MRVEPADRIKRKNEIPFEIRVEKVTRVLAIIVAFLTTFTFFFKILFF